MSKTNNNGKFIYDNILDDKRNSRKFENQNNSYFTVDEYKQSVSSEFNRLNGINIL